MRHFDLKISMNSSELLNLIKLGKIFKAKEIIENTSNLDGRSKLLYVRILIRLGKYQKAIFWLKEIDKENNKSEIRNLIVQISKSYIYGLEGKYKEALSIINDCELKIEKFGEPIDEFLSYWKALMLNIRGNIALYQGYYDIALNYYDKAIDIRNEIKDLWGTAVTLNNIGEVYKFKGNIEFSREYYNQSLEISKSNNLPSYPIVLNNLAEIHYIEGKLKESISFFEKSLKSKGIFENDVSNSETLLKLIEVCLEINNISKAKQYLKELNIINERNSISIIETKNQVAEALILKNSKRTIHKAEAQEILEKLSKKLDIPINLRIYILVNLTELLIAELKMYEEKEVLSELKNILNELYKLGQVQESIKLLSEVIYLQAKVAIIEGIPTKALHLLDQASIYAQEKKFQYLIDRIEKEQKSYQNEFTKWIDLLSNNPSLKERVEKSELEEYLIDIINDQRKSLINK